MEVGVRELRNSTSQVIEAVQSGERVVLTVHGRPVADIVPHLPRPLWLDGAALRRSLHDEAADPGLADLLDGVLGATAAELSVHLV